MNAFRALSSPSVVAALASSLSLGFLSGCATVNPSRPGASQVLTQGLHHSGEAPLSPGRGWMALAKKRGSWKLESTEVHATPAHDLGHDNGNDQTGIQISSDHPEAMLLLRDASLQAGPVASLHWDIPPAKLLSKDVSTPIPLDFEGKNYALHIHKTLSQRYAFDLKIKGQRTLTLDTVPYSWETDRDEVTLKWAGDLNRDGILDFIFERTSDRAREVSVFVSEKQGRGYRALGKQLSSGYSSD
ncbi:MAG: hypothetical protein RLZZ399_1489 [Verrucomicrobiota bacterium]